MRLWPRCHPNGRWTVVSAALCVASFLVAALVPGRSAAAAGGGEPRSVAVFDFELVDTSLQGELEGASPADLDRLRRIGEQLRDELAASGGYRVVDTAPAADAIARAGRLRACNGCELAIAAGLGADLALIGWVQKVSNLILNLNVSLREVESGRLVEGASVDIRGNTDESWARGVRYLVRHHLVGG